MTNMQIKYFLKTAEVLSFTKAASECGISQPTLSKHIKLLEESVGFPLIERGTTTVSLTAAGKIMYDYWKRSENELSATIKTAKEASYLSDDVIRIGIISGWEIRRIGILQNIINDYTALGKAVSIICLPYDELMARFKSRLIDFFVCTKEAYDNCKDDNTDAITLCISRPTIICANDSELTLTNVNEKIKDETAYVMDEAYDRSYSILSKKIMDEYDLSPRKIKTVTSVKTLDLPVQYGFGVVVMLDVMRLNTSPLCRSIFLPGSGHKIYGIYRKDNDSAELLDILGTYKDKIS